MRTSRILHIQTLIDYPACQEQVDLFRATFGESVVVTRDRAIKYAQKFDFYWARRLLSAAAWAEYEKARTAASAEYAKARTAASAEYNKACAAAQAEYNKVIAAAWAEYNRVIAVAWAEYAKARTPAQAEYDKACAAAWADAYIGDEA